MHTQPNVLITGGGGAAAVSIIKSLRSGPYRLHVADMDAHAAGLYLVAPDNRGLLPAASDPAFVSALLAMCRGRAIDVLIPTVDAELLPIARHRATFEAQGIRVLTASLSVLEKVLDKAALAHHLDGIVPLPRTEVLGASWSPELWPGRFIVKPRSGAGSRGIRLIEPGDAAPKTDDRLIAQDYLPGEEYSVDVLADAIGRPVASVPRLRLKVDSGVAVAARTVQDTELQTLAEAAVRHLGLPYVSNVQFRRDASGRPRLLEINPRFPGTMPLTVESGVDMPRLAVDHVLGHALPDRIPFRETAVVRYWTECFVPAPVLDSTGETVVEG